MSLLLMLCAGIFLLPINSCLSVFASLEAKLILLNQFPVLKHDKKIRPIRVLPLVHFRNDTCNVISACISPLLAQYAFDLLQGHAVCQAVVLTQANVLPLLYCSVDCIVLFVADRAYNLLCQRT